MGHETSECTWRQPKPIPGTNYSLAWAELKGYVREAVNDGRGIDPVDLLAYMDTLHRQALAPVRQWMQDLIEGRPGEAP
ncbi:hypothetical protein [Streptosporangium sp. NPDC051022]|uniref:hypothetical protein n=1 Tax=Streptosporangium sp. NPDC051022 TaxID=3155752 RepID=UPI00342D3A8D